MSRQADYDKRSNEIKRLESDLKKTGLSRDDAREKAREIDNRAGRVKNGES